MYRIVVCKCTVLDHDHCILSMPHARPDQVCCKCRSYCTIWNPVTKQYEGPGQVIGRQTRDNHARDDRIADVQRQNPPPPPAQALFPVNPLQNPPHFHNDVLVISKIDAIMELPFTHPNRALVFLRDPSTNEDFIWPSDEELTTPNSGRYRLSEHRNNKYYLFVERRLCDIRRNLQQLPANPDIQVLLLHIDAELESLVQQKCVEWSEQRGNGGLGRPFVNTGLSHKFGFRIYFSL